MPNRRRITVAVVGGGDECLNRIDRGSHDVAMTSELDVTAITAGPVPPPYLQSV